MRKHCHDMPLTPDKKRWTTHTKNTHTDRGGRKFNRPSVSVVVHHDHDDDDDDVVVNARFCRRIGRGRAIVASRH